MQDTRCPEEPHAQRSWELAPSAVTASAVGGSANRSVVGRVSYVWVFAFSSGFCFFVDCGARLGVSYGCPAKQRACNQVTHPHNESYS